MLLRSPLSQIELDETVIVASVLLEGGPTHRPTRSSVPATNKVSGTGTLHRSATWTQLREFHKGAGRDLFVCERRMLWSEQREQAMVLDS